MIQELKKTIYKTSDGKVFEDREEAEKWEKRYANVEFFPIYAKPDLTEGRYGPQFVGFLMVDASWSRDLLAEHYCYRTYGSSVDFVQGAQPIRNWRVGESQKEAPNEEAVIAKITQSGQIEKYAV